MYAENFTLPAYLNRIGFHGEAKADIATVTAIMRCQLFTVPFENLDVQAGKIVSLIPEEIVEKILYRNRGGIATRSMGCLQWRSRRWKSPIILLPLDPCSTQPNDLKRTWPSY